MYVPEETSVTSSNFDSYCADSVMKRMHVDVDEALSAMSSGFNAIQAPPPSPPRPHLLHLYPKSHPAAVSSAAGDGLRQAAEEAVPP